MELLLLKIIAIKIIIIVAIKTFILLVNWFWNCTICVTTLREYINIQKIKLTIFFYKCETRGGALEQCLDLDIVYCISCINCGKQYIGENHRSLKERFGEHRGYVRTEKLNKATQHQWHENPDSRVVSSKRKEKKWLLTSLTQKARASTRSSDLLNANFLLFTKQIFFFLEVSSLK